MTQHEDAVPPHHDAATVRPLTRAWVSRHLEAGERIVGTVALHGGITAEMRRLTIGGRDGGTRDLVLRTFVDVEQAEDWLNREAGTLTLLTGTGVRAPGLIAADPTAAQCEYPSLLMTHLPGSPVIADEGLEKRVPLLAGQLMAIHALRPAERPGKYLTLTTPDTVVTPKDADATAWAAAIGMIRNPAPPYEGRFLHRDFQPGNVLFDAPPPSPETPGSPASSTGYRPPGARPTSMSRTAPPASRCCTARHGACDSPKRTRRPAGHWQRPRTSAGTGWYGTRWRPPRKYRRYRSHGGRRAGQS